MNTVDFYLLCDTPIFAVKVSLCAFHLTNGDRQSCNEISCKTRIIHDSPYLIHSSVPIIYDPDVIDESIHVSLSFPDPVELTYPINNSIIVKLLKMKLDTEEDASLNILNLTQITSPEDISLILKFIFCGTEVMKPYFETFKKLRNYSLKRNLELEFKYFLFTFKNNGTLYPPTYYFDYTIKFLEFIRNQHYADNFNNFPFLQKFISVVLNYFRSDGLFGPHTAISFYLYHHFKMPYRCLPFDINPFTPKCNYDIEEFKFLNYSFVENIVSLTSPLALIWGYQSICHEYFNRAIQHFDIATSFSDHFIIIGLRLRESIGANQSDTKNFLTFVRHFFPNKIKSKSLYAHLNDYPISLNFFNDLMFLYPNEPLITIQTNNDIPKFSLPSSMLANTLLSEFDSNPDKYDFSDPSVSRYKANVKAYYKDKQIEKYENFNINEPIITTNNKKTYVHFTQYTNHFDISKIDFEKIDAIKIDPKNQFFLLEYFNSGFVLLQCIKYYQRQTNQMFVVFCSHNVTSVIIPKTVIRINESAFENCTNLTSVTFENGSLLKVIGERAFYGCTGLNAINFTDLHYLTEIGPNAFQYSGIKSINFDKESNTVELTLIKSKLTTIGEFAFSYCSKLDSVSLPLSSTNAITIKAFAFFKSPIKKATINNVEAIYDYAFAITQLQAIELPPTLKFIGSFAFAKSKLETLSLPKQIAFIQNGIIAQNPIQKPITLKGNKYLFFQNGEAQFKLFRKFDAPIIMFNNDASNLTILQQKNHAAITDFDKQMKIITSSIRDEDDRFGHLIEITQNSFDDFQMEPNMFAHLINLTTADLSFSNFDCLSDYCFFNCKSLRTVILPKSVRRINSFAFAYSGLSEINFKDLSNLKVISDFAFYETSLKSFNIPSSVEEIGSHVFSLSNPEIVLSETLDFPADSQLQTISSFAFYKSPINKISLPSSIQSIGSYAFANSKIKEIYIPKSIHRIPDGCFNDTVLETIVFEDLNSIRYIGHYAFAGCSLQSFTFSPSISFIGKSAFHNSSIQTVDFSQATKLKFIEKSAFQGTKISSLELPINITTIGPNAFCESLIKENTIYDQVKYFDPFEVAIDNAILHDYDMPIELQPVDKSSIIEMVVNSLHETSDRNDSDVDEDEENQEEEEKENQEEEEEEEYLIYLNDQEDQES